MSRAQPPRPFRSRRSTVAEQPLSPQYAVALHDDCPRAAPPATGCRDSVPRRMSWRGTFAASPEDEASLRQLAAARDDAIVIRDRAAIAEIAGWADAGRILVYPQRRPSARTAGMDAAVAQPSALPAKRPQPRGAGDERDRSHRRALRAWRRCSPRSTARARAARCCRIAPRHASAAAIVLFVPAARARIPLLRAGISIASGWRSTAPASSACPISALADHAGFNGKLRAARPDRRRQASRQRVPRRAAVDAARPAPFPAAGRSTHRLTRSALLPLSKLHLIVLRARPAATDRCGPCRNRRCGKRPSG